MNLGKIKTYVRFAKKARKICYGVDDIIKIKIAKIIFVSQNLGESSFNKISNFATNNKIEFIKLSDDEFNRIIENINIKAFAILDNNLAEAIKKNLANI